MQYGKSVDRFFSARERLEQAKFAGLEGLEPRWLMAANPVVKIKNATVLEGDAGTFNSMIFDVIRKGDVSSTTRVKYATGLTGGANAALQGADFLSKAGTVKFKAGQKRKTIVVPVVGNNTQQPDRSFVVNLFGVKGGQLKGGKTGFGLINDDDGAGPQSTTPTITINDVTQSEGNAGTSVFTFTVALSNPHDKTVTVDYNTANGTAKAADNDYEPTNGTLTFLPGEISKTVSVTVNGDINAELDETFVVNLSKAVNAIIIDAAGVGKILNEDGAPSLRIDDVTIVEGANGQPSKAKFTVSLNGALNEDLEISYTTADGTATAGVDYQAASGTLLFTAGQTSKTIEVTILGDNLVEQDETFFVNLSNLRLPDADDPTDTADVVTLTTSSGKGTISNDDDAGAVSITNVTRAEGDVGTTNFIFTVTLDKPATETASVDFRVDDGTASVVAQTGTLVFNVGETTKTITVPVTGDTLFEANETFFVNLFNPQKLTIADGQGVGTINNDDFAPTVSISDAVATEANTNSVPMAFVVSLSEASGLPVTVSFSTANNTALSGSDYSSAGGSVTFAPGETSKTVTVNILSDTVNEPSENFFVNLSNASGATIGDGQGVGTINDNDALINVNIGDGGGFSNSEDTNDLETDGGQKAWRFTITLSQAAEVPITVSYATANGTATTANNDYIAKSGSVTFQPGETEKDIDIFVRGDTDSEEDEHFFVNLTSVSSSLVKIVDSQGVGTIENDDGKPFLIIEDMIRDENAGGGGVTVFQFPVRLSEAQNDRIVKVNYATQDGGASGIPSAVWRGEDYVSSTGTLFFQPGETVKYVSVAVNNDVVNEGTEAFSVVLSNPVEADIQKSTAEGLIRCDDPRVITLTPLLPPAAPDHQTTEGDENKTHTLFFFVSMDGLSDRTITVSYNTVNGSASVGDNDYEAAGGSLTFGPGSTNQVIGVTVNGDFKLESDEDFFVNLTGLTHNGVNVPVSFDNTTSRGVIVNDDAEPVASINNVTVSEGNQGPTTVTFTVTLSGEPGSPVAISYVTEDGTASTADNDYEGKSGTINFAANEKSKTITVTVNGDLKFEPSETFRVRLTSITGPATIGVESGTATITNDDEAPPAMAISDMTISEGTGGAPTTMTFVVTLDKAATQVVTVNFATSPGTATAADFTPKNGTLVFNPGELAKTIDIEINPDDINEGNTENFFVFLSNVSGGISLDPSDAVGVGQIIDDD